MTDIETTPFHLHSLVATAPGAREPLTEFDAGRDIELRWESNGTAFTLYAARDPRPLYAGTEKRFVVRGGRTRATTFVVVASVTGGPASGSPHPGFETITLTDAVTVEISDPTLTPSAVTAAALTVTGATTLQNVTATGAQVGGTLGVTGPATLSGGATVRGLTVDGATTLSGGATLDSATVNGALTAGSSGLGAATAASLTIQSWVSMFNPRTINPGSYTASSDGLVVVTVGWPANNPGAKSNAIAAAWSQATGNIYATGGNNMINGGTMAGLGSSLTLPVKRGAPFTVALQQYGDTTAPATFTWIPFGTNATLQEVTDDALAAAGYVAPDLTPTTVPPFDPDFAISEIIAIFLEALDTTITPEESNRLRSALGLLSTHDPRFTYAPAAPTA
jgi:hypothetical protein